MKEDYSFFTSEKMFVLFSNWIWDWILFYIWLLRYFPIKDKVFHNFILETFMLYFHIKDEFYLRLFSGSRMWYILTTKFVIQIDNEGLINIDDESRESHWWRRSWMNLTTNVVIHIDDVGRDSRLRRTSWIILNMNVVIHIDDERRESYWRRTLWLYLTTNVVNHFDDKSRECIWRQRSWITLTTKVVNHFDDRRRESYWRRRTWFILTSKDVNHIND